MEKMKILSHDAFELGERERQRRRGERHHFPDYKGGEPELEKRAPSWGDYTSKAESTSSATEEKASKS